MKASFGPDTGSGKISPFGRNDKFLECCHFEERSDEKSYTDSVKISPVGRNDNTGSGKISPVGRNHNEALEQRRWDESMDMVEP